MLGFYTAPSVYLSLPGASPMFKIVPLISFSVATFFVCYSIYQFSALPINLSGNPLATPVASGPPQKQPSAAPGGQRANVPVHKALIRCLSDIDDLLDMISDPASFELVKPKILDRVRKHMAQALAQPNKGMGKLNWTAAKELEKATNRHMAAVVRANNVAPGVATFFQKEVGAVLNPQ
jgi:hypothetical protein